MASQRNRMMLRVTETGYVPDCDASRKQHAKLKPGTLVGAEIARSRSLPQHKRYWKALTAVVALCPGKWRTPEALHEALKVATGHIEIVQLVDGRLIKIPESTAFDAMSQDRFQVYCDAATRVIEDEILHGEMSIDNLLAQANDSEVQIVDRMIAAGQMGG